VSLSGIARSTTDILDKFTRLLATGLPGSDAASIDVTAAQARSALKEIVSLLGERFAGEAIFGGSDPAGTPVVGPDVLETNGFYTAIQAAVNSLGTGSPPKTAQAVLAETLQIGKTNNDLFLGNAKEQADLWSANPDNPPSDPRQSVPIGGDQIIELGLYVYRNGTTPTNGVASTGSWARDIVGALATIAQFKGSTAIGNAQYIELAKGALAGLKTGLDGVIKEQGSLGFAQQRLANAAERNELLTNQLERQVSDIVSVDVPAAMTELTNLRVQLEASYRAAVLISELTLSRFLR
jgi:flagellin-like hook-associated protein FlgL